MQNKHIESLHALVDNLLQRSRVIASGNFFNSIVRDNIIGNVHQDCISYRTHIDISLGKFLIAYDVYIICGSLQSIATD